jgi:hypothetical protein
MTKEDDKELVDRLLQADRVITLMEADENGHHLVTTGPHIQHEAADRIEALSAENERLREALRTLVGEFDTLGFFGGPSAEAWDEARAALGETK